MNKSQWKRIISCVAKGASPETLNFVPMDGDGGEQHGSWVWVCQTNKPQDGINRFARLSVTEESEEGINAVYLVEISAGGSDSYRFRNVPIAALRYAGWDSLKANADQTIRDQFIHAMKTSLDLQRGDLDSVYPRPFQAAAEPSREG